MHEGVKNPCRQCGYQATAERGLAMYKSDLHEVLKYPCRQCGHQ